MFRQMQMSFALLAVLGMFAAPAYAKDAPPAEAPRIQLAILLDTSGSMSGLINQARTQLWKIVNEFAAARRDGLPPQLTVALYEYGKSSLPAKEGYIRMIVPLTDDLDKISEELFALATNGGNEYCGQVIDRATSELDWSPRDADLKCIFIAGNEPFTQGPVKFQTACQNAIEKGISISTIFCGLHQTGIATQWAEGARLADGSYMSINQNRAVPVVAAPQDKELARLSAKLNKTYVAYGSKKQQAEAVQRQVAQDANAAKSNQAAAAARAQFKGSRLYNNAGWDLVDALRLKKVKLEDLKEEELPECLREMKPEERKKYIAEKSAERKQIQEKIKTLSAARNRYIAAAAKKAQKDGEQTLDKAIIDAARKQATRKNFKFAN